MLISKIVFLLYIFKTYFFLDTLYYFHLQKIAYDMIDASVNWIKKYLL